MDVVRDRKYLAGQQCDVIDNPEEQVSDEKAAGDEDGWFAS